ncbi:hypothetical protein ACFQ6U_29675 [Streptomyces sp. NPDC056465]|uniref:hypothetical protein n=1 Tax=unclassified Streptomyces TaxID=2593676 RepID=UPI0036B66300
MISVIDLADGGDLPSPPPTAEPDPLREPDALAEAQLLDCRASPLTSTIALLFELRPAPRFDEGTTALLVVGGLRSCRWSAGTAPVPPAAMTVVSGVPGRLDELVRAEFSFLPDARLEVVGERAWFYVLEVEDAGDAPRTPAREVRGDLPPWGSPCTVLRASGSG